MKPTFESSWNRVQLAQYADRLLTAVRPYASERGARVLLPGAPGGYGSDIDGLEGFCRTFLLAGFRLTGERGADPLGLIPWYARGIAEGVDPDSPERWVRMSEHAQAKVEAASLALILDMTREWIWERLDSAVQRRVIDYLSEAVGDDTYPPINWLWFRLVVQTFLRSVDGPHSVKEMRADLALHDTFLRSDGWMADGAHRNYDHYVGWALHLYPALWSRMKGAEDLAGPRREHDAAQLDRYLTDAIAMVGADGGPMIQGRSLIYRFAAAAPFWVGALERVPSTPLGQLRRAAARIVEYFHDHGAPDERGLLTMGYHRQWRTMTQTYSGTGSPYWASKGLLGLALPADHPVWSAPEVALPTETADALIAVPPAGWIVSATASDGISRLINHGTDHTQPGSNVGDSPLYGRFAYSTASAPLLDERAWTEPLDNAVTLIDGAGRASHRAGMELIETRVDRGPHGDVGVAASKARAHWVNAEPGQAGHGTGYRGVSTPAGTLTSVSLVRGAWELRLTRLDDAAAGAAQLRVGGWPVTGQASQEVEPGLAKVTTASAVSMVLPVGEASLAVRMVEDASPLGGRAHVPTATFPALAARWHGAFIALTADPGPVGLCEAHVASADFGSTITATWPDGRTTITFINVAEAPS